jgi:hypothetical protein
MTITHAVFPHPSKTTVEQVIIPGLKAEIESTQKAIEALQGPIAIALATSNDLARQNNKTNQQLSNARITLQTARERQTATIAKINVLERQIQALRNQLSAQAAPLTQAETTVTDLTQTLEEVSKQIAENTQTIQSNQTRYTQLSDRLQELIKDLAIYNPAMQTNIPVPAPMEVIPSDEDVAQSLANMAAIGETDAPPFAGPAAMNEDTTFAALVEAAVQATKKRPRVQTSETPPASTPTPSPKRKKHDLSLLEQIYPKGTQVSYNGKKHFILGYNKETHQFKIAPNLFVSPDVLNYLPEEGMNCLIRESYENDRQERYYKATIKAILKEPRSSDNSIRVRLHWNDYERDAWRKVNSLGVILPITDTELLGKLKHESVEDQFHKTGTGYSLQFVAGQE